MTDSRSGADIEEMVLRAVPEVHRERVAVRRRRARGGHRGPSQKWVAASRSRRRAMRAFALSAGVLLLMALGLYFGLARQENAPPAEGAARTGALGAFGRV